MAPTGSSTRWSCVPTASSGSSRPARPRAGGCRARRLRSPAAAPARQELAAAEIDRLLALTRPAPTAPRQVVPIVAPRPAAASRPEDPERTDEDAGVGVATAARLVLTASAGPTVLDAAEVHRLLVAWRLAEFLPDGTDLRAAGFPGEVHDGGSARSGSVPPVPVGSGGAVPAVVPAARSALASSPGGAPAPPGPPRTGVLPAGSDASAPRPLTAPLPVASGAGGRGRRAGRVRAVGLRPREPRPPSSPAPGPAPRGPRVARHVAGAGDRGRRDVRGGPRRCGGRRAGVSPAPAEVAALPVRVVDGVPWTQQVVATEPTCEGHAYGLAVQFLREHPCAQLDRALWSGDVGGSAIVASVAVVRMGDATSASAFKALVDSSGTGNVADLLREGRGFVGAPASLGNAGYGSAQVGESVVIAETAPGAGSGSVGESTLDRIARQATALR